jgi:protein-disulfide isomerase
MSKRKELEARQQERARKQTIQIAAIIGILAIAIIGGAVLISRNNPTAAAPAVPLPEPRLVSKAIPANADAKAPAWGPADAPVKIVEFIDYQCPACGAQWAANEEAIVAAMAPGGKVRYEYKFLTFLETRKVGSTESTDAANAALCAADQGKFLAFHNTLFGNQFDENVGQYSKDRLKKVGAAVGLDAATFNACVDNTANRARVAEMAAEADRLGVQSTPSFVINGKLVTGGQNLAALKQAIAEIAPGIAIE